MRTPQSPRVTPRESRSDFVIARQIYPQKTIHEQSVLHSKTHHPYYIGSTRSDKGIEPRQARSYRFDDCRPKNWLAMFEKRCVGNELSLHHLHGIGNFGPLEALRNPGLRTGRRCRSARLRCSGNSSGNRLGFCDQFRCDLLDLHLCQYGVLDSNRDW